MTYSVTHRLVRLLKNVLIFKQATSGNVIHSPGEVSPLSVRNPSESVMCSPVETNSSSGQPSPQQSGVSEETNDNLLPADLRSCLDNVDLSNPPGLAGDICCDLERIEYRALPQLRPIVALLALSAIASQNVSKNTKLNIYVIVTALSASGKEAHQAYLKQTLRALNLDDKLHETPRSDKTIMLDLLYSSGTSIYVLDEGHVLFRTALSSKASAYEKNMADLLLQLKTAREYRLSGNLKREIQDSVEAKIEKLSRKKNPDEEHLAELENVKELRKLTSDTIYNPFVNLVSYSVPQNIEFLFSRQEIESGLLGRIIFMRGPSKRARIRDHDFELKPSPKIVDRLRRIPNDTLPVNSNAATEMFSVVKSYFEHDKNLNHTLFGAIFARGFEQVKVISTLLALENGTIKEEMVLYALKLFLNSLEECEKNLLTISEKVADEELTIISEKVKDYSIKKGPATIGVLINNVQKRSLLIRTKVSQDSNYLKMKFQELINQKVIVEIENNRYVHKDTSQAS